MLNEYYKNIKVLRRTRYKNNKDDAPNRTEVRHSYDLEIDLLSSVGKTKNFLEILRSESGELEANKEDLIKKFKHSTVEQLNAINKGLERVGAALDSLEKIEGKAGYIGLIYYSALRHFDSKGLPVDVVREALADQRQSITNSLSGMNTEEDAIIYQLRRDNLITAEKEYIQMQHKGMRYFSQKYPDHYASKRYLSKNKDAQIFLDQSDKTVKQKRDQER